MDPVGWEDEPKEVLDPPLWECPKSPRIGNNWFGAGNPSIPHIPKFRRIRGIWVGSELGHSDLDAEPGLENIPRKQGWDGRVGNVHLDWEKHLGDPEGSFP